MALNSNISFIVGLVGNLLSILVFTSPIKTFARIVKQKSTEEYKGVPYIITLLSASLWTFYGLLKPDGLLIVTVNSAGAIFQTIYVLLFITYAPKKKKVNTGILVGVFNVGFLGGVIAITVLALHKSHEKITFVGSLCMALTIGMYAAPLSAMKMVVQTKSVMYMPFLLSFCLFLNGTIWSIYAVLVKDIYIIVPNAIGFVLGAAQLAIYFMYKDSSAEPNKQVDDVDNDDDVDTEMGPGFQEMDTIKLATANHNMHKVDEEVEEEYQEKDKKEEEEKNPNPKGPTVVSPPKGSMNRAQSVKKIIRTLSSIRPYDLDSNWATTHGPTASKLSNTPRHQKKEDWVRTLGPTTVVVEKTMKDEDHCTTPKPVSKPQSVRKITRTKSSIHPYDSTAAATDSNWAATTTADGPAGKTGDAKKGDPKEAMNRMQSVKKIMRTISSIHPYDLDSNWAATTPARGKPVVDRATSMVRPAVVK